MARKKVIVTAQGAVESDFTPQEEAEFDAAVAAHLESAPPALEIVRGEAYLIMESEAERARGKMLNSRPIQQTVYSAKREEAAAFKTWRQANPAGAPPPGEFPFLDSEVLAQADRGNAGYSHDNAVADIDSAAAKSAPYGAEVERVRRRADLALAAASTIAEIDTIVAELAWPEMPAEAP